MAELASLSDVERDQALDRFRMLQPHLEEGRSLRQVAREASIPYRTAQRWLAGYRRYGVNVLCFEFSAVLPLLRDAARPQPAPNPCCSTMKWQGPEGEKQSDKG